VAHPAVPSDLADLVANIHRLARRTLRRGRGAPRLRGAQVELLRLLEAQPGMRVSDAAKELGLAGNSVSTLVRQLIELDLLKREPDPEDGRAVLLLPTREALRRLREWQDRRSALYREHFARLSDGDQAALAAALPALRRLAGSLHQDLEAME
jgi:DNA-binding MarR family transcriptional regulator